MVLQWSPSPRHWLVGVYVECYFLRPFALNLKVFVTAIQCLWPCSYFCNNILCMVLPVHQWLVPLVRFLESNGHSLHDLLAILELNNILCIYAHRILTKQHHQNMCLLVNLKLCVLNSTNTQHDAACSRHQIAPEYQGPFLLDNPPQQVLTPCSTGTNPQHGDWCPVMPSKHEKSLLHPKPCVCCAGILI